MILVLSCILTTFLSFAQETELLPLTDHYTSHTGSLNPIQEKPKKITELGSKFKIIQKKIIFLVQVLYKQDRNQEHCVLSLT